MALFELNCECRQPLSFEPIDGILLRQFFSEIKGAEWFVS